METVAVISLVGNVIQFVDFSAKLIAKSTELYRSSEGALAENIDTKAAIDHLVLLNDKLKGSAATTNDNTLKNLCESCQSAADELLTALNKVKVSGKQDRWKSMRKALRSVWDKEKIRELEGRLARFREQLNLHITVELREQVLELQTDHKDRLEGLDSTTRGILDAVIQQQDVFEALNDKQFARMEKLFSEMVLKAEDAHATTRREITQEIRRREREKSIAITHEPCWFVPLPRNQNFVGRSSQLHQLEATIFGENHASKVAIIGLGGVGKTQLALELAYRTKDNRPECSVFWVSATNTENVHQGYLGIAQQLRIPGWEGKKEDVRELVQQYLGQKSTGEWLLVIDNADDLDMWLKNGDNNAKSDRLIDSLPRSSNGSIVFTTRNRKAASKFAHENMIHVGDMDEEAATHMLRNSLTNKAMLDDVPAMVQLLGFLAYLPLAIVQAAAYINENDISLTEYVSLFDDREENIVELLSEDFEDEQRYRDIKNPIATTWLISFEQIRARDALAADYLSFMACIDPKAIPLSLLPPAQTKKKEIDAIGTLSAYSFVTKRPADNCLDMHRLVHLATRNWLREQSMLSEWTEKTIERIATIFPSHDHSNRALWRSYLPHLHYVQASDVFQKNVEKNIPLIEGFGSCLCEDGRWKEAEIVLMQVMEINLKVLGPEHPSTLINMDNMGLIYKNQGRWSEAEELDVRALEMKKRVFGEKHSSVLRSMGNLAVTFLYQQRWKEAEELGLQVLEERTSRLGKEHPDTLVTMINLAIAYEKLMRWKEAEKLFVQVLEKSTSRLGNEHPTTLHVKLNLSKVYGSQHRWKEAEDLDNQVAEISTKILGEEHPITLGAMSSKVWAYNIQNRWTEAEALGVQVMEMTKNFFGEEHPRTIDSTADLTWTYIQQRQWNEAEILGVKLVGSRRKVLGEEHPDTLSGMHNLVWTYINQGQWKEAEMLGVKLVEARRKVLGEEHSDTLGGMHNLAWTYINQGQWKEAEILGVKLVETSRRVLGSGHPETLRRVANLALTYKNQGRFKEVEELDEQLRKEEGGWLAI